jgi:hypothetical protein
MSFLRHGESIDPMSSPNDFPDTHLCNFASFSRVIWNFACTEHVINQPCDPIPCRNLALAQFS